MIKLQRISTADGFLYEYMEQLITAAFPPEEYRPLEELRLYTDSKPHFYNNIIFHHDTPVGFITYWDFGKFYYIEHFAVDPAQRNGGHGKNVEMPEEEMAQRRINFYKRQGFALWEKPYLQPPYRPGDDYLPMLLMAHGNLECERDFETVKNSIYREVYNV